MNVLCTDKTGTLTQDRIILKRHLDIRGEDSERVLEYAFLNSHYQSGLKNLLDVAVLQHIELGKNLHLQHQYQEGVIEGRKVFGNITKYIKMGASSNFGNMFSVLGASIFLPFLPMLPIQVLTNNLLYDFSQTTIPTDNVDEDYLKIPRKWDIGNIFKFMVFIGPISSIFDYAAVGWR